MNFETDGCNLINTFGKIYAETPSQFQFQRGELSLIKQLVSHVKHSVDVNGINSGLHRFKYMKNTRKKTNRPQKIHASVSISRNENEFLDVEHINTIDNSNLKAGLFRRIQTCLKQFSADVEVESLKENIVDVQINRKTGQIVGSVFCVICQVINKKTIKPKRVHFHDSNDRSYWVVSNFQKHLANVHHLKMTDNHRSIQQKGEVKSENNIDENEENLDKISLNENSQSLEIEVVDVEIEQTDVEIEELMEENYTESLEHNVNWLYEQFSTQIMEMMSTVLTSGDAEECMMIELEGKLIPLTVARISGDGNCLFATIAHQLFRLPINSQEHKKSTKELRAEVVDYILTNFETFEHSIKDRVYEIKNKNDITDISTECKLYVRLVLSREGKYGGYETVKAVCEKYKINILTFCENGSCYIHNKKMAFGRTIALAYRVGYVDEHGNTHRNHYDSVCDIKAEDMYTISHLINEQIKQNNTDAYSISENQSILP